MEDFIYAIILLISMIVGTKNLEFRVKILKERNGRFQFVSAIVFYAIE